MLNFKKVIFIGATLGSLLCGRALEAHAASNAANSDVTVGFEADETITTDLLNPLDPDAPVTGIDPDNPATGNKGSLTIDSVPNIRFGKVKISSKNETYKALNENPFIQVTDRTGSGAGWVLKAEMTPFETADQTNPRTLKGGFLKFLNGKLKTTGDNLSGLPVAETVSLSTAGSSAVNVMSAATDMGKGTWLNTFIGTKDANENIILEVPSAAADAAEYKSTITWTLESSVKP